jgi:hypothetical protein
MNFVRMEGSGFGRPNADNELPIDIPYQKMSAWLVMLCSAACSVLSQKLMALLLSTLVPFPRAAWNAASVSSVVIYVFVEHRQAAKELGRFACKHVLCKAVHHSTTPYETAQPSMNVCLP